jgi:hypothetical protein
MRQRGGLGKIPKVIRIGRKVTPFSSTESGDAFQDDEDLDRGGREAAISHDASKDYAGAVALIIFN